MISWSAQEDVNIIVAKLSTCGIWLFCLFDIAFVIVKGKGWIRFTTVWPCLSFYITSFFTIVLETYEIKSVLIVIPLEAVLSFELHFPPLNCNWFDDETFDSW